VLVFNKIQNFTLEFAIIIQHQGILDLLGNTVLNMISHRAFESFFRVLLSALFTSFQSIYFNMICATYISLL